MIKEITSRNNEFIKYLVSLKENKNIKKEQKFLIEGMHLINEAKNYLVCVLTLEEIPNLDCDQYIVTREILAKLSNNKSTSKVIGVVNLIEEKEVKSNKLIYLNKVQDPGNVGTIFRTALAFNYFDIIADEGTASKYNSKVVQSSQGSIFKLNILEKNIEYLRKLKKDGYKIIVTCLDTNSKKISEICKVFDKICIVFGNEGQGVDQEILALSDEKLMIEIANIDSLNVAVSAGIILYSFKH